MFGLPPYFITSILSFFLYSCGIAVPFNAYYLYTHTCPQNRSHCLEVFGDRVCPSSRGWEHVLIRSMVPCMIVIPLLYGMVTCITDSPWAGGSSWCVSNVSVCALDLILRGHELLGSAKFTTDSASSLRGTMFDGPQAIERDGGHDYICLPT